MCRCEGECGCGDDAIKKPAYPDIPNMSIRGYGDFSLGTRTGDHKKRTDQRKAYWAGWMEEAKDAPEDYSPVVPYREPGEWMVGMKIEARWWVGDSSNEEYLHCFEGTVLEVIPYADSRPNYEDFRLCKHAVVKVQWNEEFDMIDSHVPLNPKKYMNEKVHCGWNLLKTEYVRYAAEVNALARQLGVNASAAVSKHSTSKK